jgi:pimeloyl-ACP methyl ester carboxylesterase
VEGSGFHPSGTKVEKQVRGEMNSVPRQPALSLIRATFDFDPLPSLTAYPGPKLSIITPHGGTPTDLHNLVSGLPHEVIRATSHWPHLDAPDEFNRLLDRFLASAGSAGSRP